MKYIFLIYAPRSGSTLFSRCMAKYSRDVLFLPEFRLLERLIQIGEPKVKALSKKDLGRVIETDHQFSNLRLSKKEIDDLTEGSPGMGIRQIIDNLVRIYADKMHITPRIVVFKRGDIIRHHKSLQEIFRDVEYIQIIRDVRGVVNSCLSSKSPYLPGLNMGRGDILYIVRRWLKNIVMAEELAEKNNSRVHVVQYEEFCRDYERITRQMIDEIGGKVLEGNFAEENSDKFLIGEKEVKIHSLVTSPPQLSRINDWQNKLTKRQCTFIEIMAHEKIEKFGYELKYLNSTGAAEKTMLPFVYAINHFVRNIFYAVSLIAFNARNGNAMMFWLRNQMRKN